jgi:hypothetical protein
MLSGDTSTAGTATAGGTVAGVRLAYRLSSSGPWSLYSANADSFTVPDDPPPPIGAALEADQWEFIGSVTEDPALPGRFYDLLRIIPAEGPTYTGVQWDLSDDIWRNLENTGTDGEGAILWRPLPFSVGGIEHTVQYEEVLNTARLRYSVDDSEFSEASTTAKGWIGPTVPAAPTPFSPGDRITLASTQQRIAGFVATIPIEPRPPEIPTDGMTITVDSGTVTVSDLPNGPPPGAVSMRVYYNGRHYPVVDGVATFPETGGVTLVLARAIDADGNAGPAIYKHI